MLKEQLSYRCDLCGTTADYTEGKNAPVCCGHKMIPEPLPQYTSTANPEMARNSAEDEPCNDDRGKES